MPLTQNYDIWLHITSTLYPKDVVILGYVSRFFSTFVHEDAVWTLQLNLFRAEYDLYDSLTPDSPSIALKRAICLAPYAFLSRFLHGKLCLPITRKRLSIPVDTSEYVHHWGSITSMTFVPGGRFLLVEHVSVIALYDLGRPSAGVICDSAPILLHTARNETTADTYTTIRHLFVHKGQLHVLVSSSDRDCRKRFTLTVHTLFLGRDSHFTQQGNLKLGSDYGIWVDDWGSVALVPGRVTVAINLGVLAWDFVDNRCGRWYTMGSSSNDPIFKTIIQGNTVAAITTRYTMTWRIELNADYTITTPGNPSLINPHGIRRRNLNFMRYLAPHRDTAESLGFSKNCNGDKISTGFIFNPTGMTVFDITSDDIEAIKDEPTFPMSVVGTLYPPPLFSNGSMEVSRLDGRCSVWNWLDFQGKHHIVFLEDSYAIWTSMNPPDATMPIRAKAVDLFSGRTASSMGFANLVVADQIDWATAINVL